MRLHKESKGTITVATAFVFIFGFFALYFLGKWSLLLLIPLLVLYGLVFWFFRVPDRKIGEYTSEIIAPVDGKVVMIKEVEENEVLQSKAIQISIFMSPLNVHICRYPVTGKVIYQKYHPGKYLLAWNEKSSTDNERTTIAVESLHHQKVVFRQIAGFLARRIVCYTKVEDQAKAGYELGFIKFGSRMDIFLPTDAQVLCKIGDITKGGVDTIAQLSQ